MSTNTYLTKFPYEQELIEFCKTVDISNYGPANNIGGWHKYHNNIDWKEICAEKDQKSINKKISEIAKTIPHTKEWNAKISATKKIRTHCCIICKQSFNPGNWARHYH